jgi:hypothetical protein
MRSAPRSSIKKGPLEKQRKQKKIDDKSEMLHTLLSLLLTNKTICPGAVSSKNASKAKFFKN